MSTVVAQITLIHTREVTLFIALPPGQGNNTSASPRPQEERKRMKNTTLHDTCKKQHYTPGLSRPHLSFPSHMYTPSVTLCHIIPLLYYCCYYHFLTCCILFTIFLSLLSPLPIPLSSYSFTSPLRSRRQRTKSEMTFLRSTWALECALSMPPK